MTEQEIVNCLKENKSKGVAFCFMLDDVWDWVRDHLGEPKLLYLNPRGEWDSLEDIDFDDFDNVVFTLDDDYELPQKPSGGEWVEFEIDQRGNFHCFLNGDMHYFFWANWNAFLAEAHSFGYTAFGGWRYADNEHWFTSPVTVTVDGGYYAGFNDYDKPAIPVKIRFWRVKK